MEDHDGQERTTSEIAPQACGSCRKQKRRCDKQLPTCSLCLRIGRNCGYSAETQTNQPSPEEFAALKDQVASLEQLLRTTTQSSGSLQSGTNGTPNGSSSNSSNSLNGNSPASLLLSPGQPPPWTGPASFPSLFFLDSNAFEYERFQIQAPHVKVPPGALTALGSSAELREMIEHYFATVHVYYPIISKIRLYQHLANPLHEPGADIALLFLAMKLICSDIPEGQPPQTQLYLDVKSFYSYVEAQNGFSIQLIQSLCLISLYELGHCVYPAAYLSIGASARLGHAMGLHAKGVPQMLARPSTWTEQEERRRVWWGVIVLDRFINIGHRGKSFGSNDPGLDCHLPTDDAAWDRGQMLVAAPLSLSASQTTRVSPFARTCQSAHLLGKAIAHIDDKQLPLSYRFSEALQISRTLRALADVLPDDTASPELMDTNDLETSAPYTSMAIAYSGLLTLYDAYSCTEQASTLHLAGEAGPGAEHGRGTGLSMGEEQLQMQQASIHGLEEISSRVLFLARRVRRNVDTKGVAAVSPLVVDAIYQAAANCKLSNPKATSRYRLMLTMWSQTRGTFAKPRIRRAASDCWS